MIALLVIGALTAGSVIGFGLGRIRRKNRARAAPSALARRISGPVSRDRSQEALLAAFRSDEIPEPDDSVREDLRILADALREITKRRGAVAAVLWILDDARGGVAIPVVSSADDARTSDSPAFMPVLADSDRSLVEWSARERVIAFDRDGDLPRLAVAPIEVSDLLGALSLHFDDRSSVVKAAVREWLPQHAKMMQTWYDLVRTRSDVARQNFRLRGLIRTAGTLQAERDPLALERLLVGDALTVVGADWATLVRWDGESRTGEIRAATAEAIALGVDFEGLVVTAESIAGQVCADGRPQVFSDALGLVRGEDLVFGGRARLGSVGALLVIPLRRGDRERPTGALVCGHKTVGALRGIEARNARDLANIAAGALETAWQVNDARRSASIDPLTGLANRRGFDERLAQVFLETDRYGGHAGLILIDIDHFKRVNDAFGHEAGDAVLVAVATAVVDGRRTVDLCARLGGEELAVLLPQTDAGGAREVAERLRRRIEDLRVRTVAGEVRVTASFGVTDYAARAGQAAEKVVARADTALYAAKHDGRNRVEVAT